MVSLTQGLVLVAAAASVPGVVTAANVLLVTGVVATKVAWWLASSVVCGVSAMVRPKAVTVTTKHQHQHPQ